MKITKIFKVAAATTTAYTPTHILYSLSEEACDELQATIAERRSSGLDLTTGKNFQPFKLHDRPMVNQTYGQEEIDPSSKTVMTPYDYKPEGFTFCEGDGIPIRCYQDVKNVWVDSEGWVCTHCLENHFDANPSSDYSLKGVDVVIENRILETDFTGEIHFEFGRYKDLFQFLAVKVGSSPKPCIFEKVRYTSNYGNKVFSNLAFTYWRMDADCPESWRRPNKGICSIADNLDYKVLRQRYVSAWEKYDWFDDIDHVKCTSYRETWAYQNTLQEMVDAVTPYNLDWMSTILDLMRYQIMVDNGQKIPVTQLEKTEYESATHNWWCKLEEQVGSSVPLIHLSDNVFLTKDPKEFPEVQMVKERIYHLKEDDIKLDHRLDISNYLTNESVVDRYTVTPTTAFEVVLNNGVHIPLEDIFFSFPNQDEKKLSDIKAGRFLIKERKEEGGVHYVRTRPYLDTNSLAEWKKQ